MKKPILSIALLAAALVLAAGTTHARWLNVNTGRFQTMDSFEGVPAEPETLHKYTYVRNDPINRIDPSGHFYGSGERITVTGVQGILARVVLPTVARAPRTVYTVAQWNRAAAGFQAGVRGSTAFKVGAVGVLVTTIAGNVAMVVDALDGPDDTETIFYTVQGPDDATRLRSTGEPWPAEPDRAHLGPGVYAWKYLSEAESYRQSPALRQRPDLLIILFGIKNSDLDSFSHFDVDLAPNPDAWLDRYSALRGGTSDHGYQYVTRGTQYGTEHYFHKSVFPFLRFR
jgi:hypothetical protein